VKKDGIDCSVGSVLGPVDVYLIVDVWHQYLISESQEELHTFKVIMNEWNYNAVLHLTPLLLFGVEYLKQLIIVAHCVHCTSSINMFTEMER